MSRNVEVSSATGAAAIAHSFTPAWGAEILRVCVHFSAAPTTSESLTIKINSILGAAYDTVIYTINPSTASDTDIVYQPTSPLVLASGDSLDIAFANTDTRTYGSSIYYDAQGR